MDSSTSNSNRWNPAHFGEVPRKLDSNGNPTVFWDESLEPPDPDDFDNLIEYEEAWQKWETENSNNLTYVAESERVFPCRELSPKKSNSADSAKSTPFVKKDCSNASQVYQSTTMLENSQNSQELTQSPHHRHVNPLPLKESAWVEKIPEIVSPQYYELLPELNRNSSVWKTYPDYYQHPSAQEKNPEHISNRCSGSFASVGMMRSGLLLELDLNLEPDGLVKDSYSLPRPGALSWSGKGRPPGTTKSEAKAKKLGLIGKNEVYNPEWLEQEFGLPIGWTDPQECRAATELLELEGHHSEIVSTPGLVKSSGGEYSTSTPSSKKGKSKSSDCWYTPIPIVELVTKVLGEITLDPCADNGKHLEVKKHYTIADDGLIREWEGQVFMNPPLVILACG
ncbi:MAG: DNA N-6-adenine-methyltransferase [Cyanobacteria bacterium J06632_19]